MLDKGFQIVQPAIKYKQKIIQPIFASSERDFCGNESLCISEVASDRSGNERAVKCVKRSGYITKGLESHQSYKRMDKVWLAFLFQTNFMFKPVL